METPQAVLGPGGAATAAAMVHAAAGRCRGLHYGTYDYSAALGIAAAHQASDHPAADHAKAVMQVAVAGTGARAVDGSSNLLPVGPDRDAAWRRHAELVTRALRRGFYQGWDLHPAQLPTRYLAVYASSGRRAPAALDRLAAYLAGAGGAVLDEPATARALATVLVRAVDCGALGAAEARWPGPGRPGPARRPRRRPGRGGPVTGPDLVRAGPAGGHRRTGTGRPRSGCAAGGSRPSARTRTPRPAR